MQTEQEAGRQPCNQLWSAFLGCWTAELAGATLWVRGPPCPHLAMGMQHCSWGCLDTPYGQKVPPTLKPALTMSSLGDFRCACLSTSVSHLQCGNNILPTSQGCCKDVNEMVCVNSECTTLNQYSVFSITKVIVVVVTSLDYLTGILLCLKHRNTAGKHFSQFFLCQGKLYILNCCSWHISCLQSSESRNIIINFQGPIWSLEIWLWTFSVNKHFVEPNISYILLQWVRITYIENGENIFV